MPEPFKLQVHAACVAAVEQRIATAQQALDSALEATANESKSTAGDKHETGRAMAQLEQEKASKQLAEANKLKAMLARIDPTSNHSTIALGSLIDTNRGWFYLGAPVGKVTANGVGVFALSLASPMGQQLRGKHVGDAIELNGQKTEIRSVV